MRPPDFPTSCRRSHKYPRTYAKAGGRRPRLSVAQPQHQSTLTSAPPPPVLTNDPPFSLAMDDGTYSKLNHNWPNWTANQRRIETQNSNTSSTSSGGSSTSPLLDTQRCSGDDAFTSDNSPSPMTQLAHTHHSSSVPGHNDTGDSTFPGSSRPSGHEHSTTSSSCSFGSRGVPLPPVPSRMARHFISGSSSSVCGSSHHWPPVGGVVGGARDSGPALGVVVPRPVPEYLQLVSETPHYETVN